MGNELGRSTRARWVLTAVTDYITYTVSSSTMLVLAITVVSLAPMYAHQGGAAGSPVIYDSGVGGEQLVQVPVPQQHPATEPACVQTRRWSNQAGDTWTFTRCGATAIVTRGGGPAGPCATTHDADETQSDPKSDCVVRGADLNDALTQYCPAS